MLKIYGTTIKKLIVTEAKSVVGRCFVSSLDGIYQAPVVLSNEDIIKGYLIAMETMATSLQVEYEFISIEEKEESKTSCNYNYQDQPAESQEAYFGY